MIALSARRRHAEALLHKANRGLLAEMRQRAEMQSRLVQSERMASMGALAAGMAHEINNPLTYVIGNLKLVEAALQRDPGLRQAYAPLLADALDGADRVRRIVADLRTFARPTDEITKVHLGEAFDRAAKLAAAEIKHRARLVRQYDGNILVHGNEARLVQVAINLMTNAAHAIEAGARDRHEILVRVWREQDLVVAEVTDSGAGMPPEVVCQSVRTHVYDEGAGARHRPRPVHLAATSCTACRAASICAARTA